LPSAVAHDDDDDDDDDAWNDGRIGTEVRPTQTKYTYRDHNGKKLCEACWTNVAPRCARCNLAVTGTVTTALKKQWHPECLKCEGCKAQLQATFYLLDHKPNVPYCSFCIKGIEQSEQAARDRWGSFVTSIASTLFRTPNDWPQSACDFESFIDDRMPLLCRPIDA
jgi:hypothetical protein